MGIIATTASLHLSSPSSPIYSSPEKNAQVASPFCAHPYPHWLSTRDSYASVAEAWPKESSGRSFLCLEPRSINIPNGDKVQPYHAVIHFTTLEVGDTDHCHSPHPLNAHCVPNSRHTHPSLSVFAFRSSTTHLHQQRLTYS